MGGAKEGKPFRKAHRRIGFYGCSGKLISVGPIEGRHPAQFPKALRVDCPCGFHHLIRPSWRKAKEGEVGDIKIDQPEVPAA